jgi:GTPase
MIDATCEDAVAAYKIIRAELKAYSKILAAKPEIIAFNKIDAVEPAVLKKAVAAFTAKTKKTPLLMSAATQKNVDEAVFALYEVVKTTRRKERMPDPEGVVTEGWQP